MMQKDEGLIIFTKIIKDNHLFIKILSKNNGLCLGTVFGGNSKKKKNIYQIGNFILFNLIKKNENLNSNISGDINEPLISNFFNDKFKLHAILSCCSLINCTVNENQKFQNIYLNSIKLYESFNQKHWFYNYAEWLIMFLSELGYGFDLTDINSENKYINIENLKLYNIDSLHYNLNNNKFIEFPFDLFVNKVINYNQCKLLFNIFEFIMKKHLLNHSTNNIPKIYFLFKELILKNINKYE